MFYIHRNKIIVFLLLLGFSLGAQAQELNPLYDRKPVRFGFGLMGNTAKLKFTVKNNSLLTDTLKSIESVTYPGFGLGGLANFRLAENWDIRTMINIQFAQRDMNYQFRSDVLKTAQIESTYMELPLSLKFKSKRHKNWRMYVLGGVTYRFDFTSDAQTDRSDTKPIVAIYPNTFSYDIGFGLDVYFEFFKFSPELKLSNGLGNQLVPDGFIYAGSLERVSPKLLQFSLIFQ
ncbi:MAG: PorT family protein [Bacteroidia bacterium]|nr:PorT family protein [Bacteroidia bacterium]NNJ55642.1 PorT family protein [Bacteroidia bacterium]